MAWWKDPQKLIAAMANLVDQPTGCAKAKGGGNLLGV